MQKKNRIHDWRKLKWPFCVTFLYYALLCLYTGSAEASEAGFLAVLIIALLIGMIIQFPIRSAYVGSNDGRKAGVKDAAGLISNKLLRLGIILLGKVFAANVMRLLCLRRRKPSAAA